jgi:hypothetical protein
MAKLTTHYDNLKVVRDAPPEVIRAAYKTLSQKYHPDKNPGNPEAARIMAILNEAYRVLSDPDLRREHDRWIARQSAAASAGSGWDAADRARAQERARQARADDQAEAARRAAAEAAAAQDRVPGAAQGPRWGLLAMLLAGVGFMVVLANADKRDPDDGYQYSQSPSPARAAADADAGAASTAGGGAVDTTRSGDDLARPSWVRPETAPNGEPWPQSSGYLSGEPKRARDGLSELTIDATDFDADVHAKLVRIEGTDAFPVRQVYIAGGDTFTLKDIAPGRYDVRYRDLDSGGLARSDPFDLEETPVTGGVEYSRMSMTLYKVANGNMQTHDLSEQDF